MAVQIIKPKSPKRAEKKQSTPQFFSHGEEVVVAKKSRVVDKKREHEDIPKEARVPIDVDVTGVKGRVMGAAYSSPTKGGEACVPIELGDGNVIGVPVSRLERASKTPRLEKSDEVRPGAGAAYAPETIEFWRKYFENEKAAKKKSKKS